MLKKLSIKILLIPAMAAAVYGTACAADGTGGAKTVKAETVETMLEMPPDMSYKNKAVQINQPEVITYNVTSEVGVEGQSDPELDEISERLLKLSLKSFILESYRIENAGTRELTNYVAAISSLTQKIKNKEKSDGKWNMHKYMLLLGRAHERLGAFETAINCYKESIKTDPEYVEAYTYLARTQESNGMKEAASETYNSLARLYEKSGLYEHARKYRNKAKGKTAKPSNAGAKDKTSAAEKEKSDVTADEIKRSK